MEYTEFIKSKSKSFQSTGFEVKKENLNSKMYEWQQDITSWALKKGKAAMFEDCGLGKTPQQLEWSRQVCEETKGSVIIYAPLAVASQTKREGEKFGIDVNLCREKEDIRKGINIANYEIMEHFDPNKFSGIVLDESSILKHHTSKTRQYLTDAYRDTPYKLACTATPAPNDFMEIGNHSEFFGIMSRSEMLSTFFVHDGGETAKWRLKGHAEDKFWEWIASWACVLKNPADLGYSQDGYNLPNLNIIEHLVKSNNFINGEGQFLLFPEIAQSLNDRRAARKESLDDRVKTAVEIANSTDKQVLVWCDLNDESAKLAKNITAAIEVKGSDSNDHKTNTMLGFSSGDVRCLVSKPSIAGWGMNWQNCSEMIFVGLSDSFEAYYQAVRRCWRFGQKNQVNVHIITSEAEGAVKANIERKQADAERMSQEMIKHTQKILEADIKQSFKMSTNYIAPEKMKIPNWLKGEIA